MTQLRPELIVEIWLLQSKGNIHQARWIQAQKELEAAYKTKEINQFLIDSLKTTIATEAAEITGVNTALLRLENKELEESSITVVSFSSKKINGLPVTAQIVIRGNSGDKKTSITRHIQLSGNHYTGKSLFLDKPRTYALVPTEVGLKVKAA